MEILKVAFTIMATIVYSAMTFFVAYAIIKIRELRRTQMKMMMLVMSEHLRGTFNELNNLKATLNELVENENFEEAKKLKTVIENAEESAMNALRHFQDMFGNDACKVTITKVNTDKL